MRALPGRASWLFGRAMVWPMWEPTDYLAMAGLTSTFALAILGRYWSQKYGREARADVREAAKSARHDEEARHWREVGAQIIPEARTFVRSLSPMAAEQSHTPERHSERYAKWQSVRDGLGRLSVGPRSEQVRDAAQHCREEVARYWAAWHASLAVQSIEEPGPPFVDPNDEVQALQALQRRCCKALDTLVDALHDRVPTHEG